MATGPECSYPNRANVSRPKRSTTAPKSSTRESSDGSDRSSRCDGPSPLVSYRTSCLFSARRSYQRRISGNCHSIWMWVNGGGICTNGMPSPIVQKAMLTPSAVWAYWMRGSIAALSYPQARRLARPISAGLGHYRLHRGGGLAELFGGAAVGGDDGRVAVRR